MIRICIIYRYCSINGSRRIYLNENDGNQKETVLPDAIHNGKSHLRNGLELGSNFYKMIHRSI